jgi:hypothetical protein
MTEAIAEVQALEAIAQQLQKLTEALAPTKQLLGFGEAPKSETYVFCNRNNGGVWYTLNEQNQPNIIEQQALTGYVRKLEFSKVQRRGKETCKLRCTIQAECTYVLESAHDSNFSKGMISAIAFLSPKELRESITVVPQASTQSAEVLFCNIYQDGKQVFAPYDDQTDWKLAARAAIDAVLVANDEAPAMVTAA